MLSNAKCIHLATSMFPSKQASHPDRLEDDATAISGYLQVVANSWRLICVVALAVFGVGVFYAALQTPFYRADVLVQIDSRTSSSPDNEALGRLASLFDSKVKAGADSEMELIRSRLVVGEAVRQLQLEVTARPRYFPIVGKWLVALRKQTDANGAPFGLTRFAWGGERIDVARFEVPRSDVDRQFRVRAGPDGSFKLLSPNGKLLGRGKVGTELVIRLANGEARILITTMVARAGAEFTVVRHSVQATILGIQNALSILETKPQSGMIRISLEGLDPERVSDVVNKIAQEYVAQDSARRSSEAAHSLTFLESQLPTLRQELQRSEDRYNAFRNSKGTVDLGEESRLLLQQLVDMDASMRTLQQERADVSQRYTPGHPLLAAIDAKITDLQATRNALSRRISMLPDTELAALRLMRDVRVNSDLYTNLLNSAQQLRVVKAGNVGNVRIVDVAVPPENPVKPNWRVILALSAVLGVLLGFAVAILNKTLRGGVERGVEIERALGVRVCAVVPHSERQVRLQEMMRRRISGLHVLAARAPGDPAVEGLRSLRTALQSASASPANNVVVVTSSRAGVGKSFIAVNLAAVLAAGGKRVLLIDADMRMGNIHASFTPQSGPGLCELLRGAHLHEVVIRGVMHGVDLIPRGGVSPNAADLLASVRLTEILRAASERYDAVVVDTPPVLAVTDATLLAKQAGTTLLVVRHGMHPVSEESEALNRLRDSGVTVSGTLFTDVPDDRFGYGSRYGNATRYTRGRGKHDDITA